MKTSRDRSSVVQGLLHHVVPVAEVVDLLQPHLLGDGGIVLLVIENHFADRRAAAGHFVVGRTNQDARVAFADQLDNRARGKQRQIIRVRLDRSEYFALMRLPRAIPLDKYFRRLFEANAILREPR